MGMTSHQSARCKSTTWLTPPEIIHALGPFDLDPCCPENMPWRTATTMWHEAGLARSWEGRVWLNPPFNETGKWLSRLADHGHGIALIAARTETKTFFKYVWDRAQGILFLRGRPHFYYPNGTRAPFNSGCPICLVGYGAFESDDLAIRMGESGKYIEL